MQFQPNAASLRSLISRRMQISFIVGLLLGILIGWVFSGLVGAVMRFGFAILLLVPLALAIWFWFKVRNPHVITTGIVFLGKRVEVWARPGYGRLILGRFVHVGDENSHTTMRPPGAVTRSISASAARGSLTLRRP